MATWSNLGLQDSASPLMEQLNFFHDHTLLILIMITILVGYLMFMLFFNKFTNRFLLHGQTIEIIWTILPAIVLMFIALPSLRILYLLDEINSPAITLKTIGHQWYWSYEYSDFLNLEFDSYMVPTNELETNGFRLLDVDNRIVLPMNTQIRILVTAADVLHSWTVPALGVKVDGTPGRLNQTNFLMNRPGLFFGQCSEICGANHSFMPIVLESSPTNYFIKWITAMNSN
uniref:Cytochrome c oxidase subunit 2 n=21 Tax=Simulium TaxID=7191 RepID=O79797_9DIPT|nr:cytochrome c oxidase subunit II [Simulium variegatum]YP_009544253.1 cytochrome c oxidase subunit II [Simulium maculatum]YP_009919080.1 cytochrome c oxidase subunit II [Simulium noelleri]AAC64099.1 cytochrome oxidase subunit II [Simulium piperi]ABB83934.1 cytochrome oxidase II [Simulium hunteri]ABB83945.1 cytochrome oxidase II [Simulium vandalicum]ABB83949.1 cytochrome oxidase II [Simulium tormentor]ABB83950.1 cytochrome oxidase II [Simulium venustum]ABB83951.1 cytochrome oxidase II [Simu